MKIDLSPILALAVLAAPAGAAVVQGELGQVAAGSEAAAGAADINSIKAQGNAAWGEATGAAPVSAVGRNDTRGNYAVSADLDNPAPKKGLKPGEVPTPKPGIIARAGGTLKKYSPHLIAAGVGAAGGAAIAAVAGAGLIGGALTGAGLGLAALYLMKKGQTGAAIGAVSFGIAGLALGGPVGGIVGALVGGLGAWALGKFFS
jgi:hypothetical protein